MRAQADVDSFWAVSYAGCSEVQVVIRHSLVRSESFLNLLRRWQYLQCPGSELPCGALKFVTIQFGYLLVYYVVRNDIPLTTDLDPFVSLMSNSTMLHFTHKHTMYLSCSGSELTPSLTPSLIDLFPFELVAKRLRPYNVAVLWVVLGVYASTVELSLWATARMSRYSLSSTTEISLCTSQSSLGSRIHDNRIRLDNTTELAA